MKVKKYKNGTIKITAESKQDSNNLLNFLGGGKCPRCGSNKVRQFDFGNNICDYCNKVYNILPQH